MTDIGAFQDKFQDEKTLLCAFQIKLGFSGLFGAKATKQLKMLRHVSRQNHIQHDLSNRKPVVCGQFPQYVQLWLL
jgi:hypothetical protein